MIDPSPKSGLEYDSITAEQALHEREAWLNGQKLAFEAAMSGKPLADSLEALVNVIVNQTNGAARPAFYLFPSGGGGLRLVAGMNHDYASDLTDLKIGPESLPFSLAMHTGEPVITFDVEQELDWAPFLSLARKYNYRACWSFPVSAGGRPALGMLSIYFEEPRAPKSVELEMAGILAQTAGIIMSKDKESAERAQTEEALRKSEERYRSEAARLHATLKNMTDAVYIGDTSGITLANQSALDQLGYSDYEELNRNIGVLAAEIQTRDALTDEIILPGRQAFARALAGEYVTQNVKITNLKSGSEHIVRSAATPVIVDGQIVAAVAINTDITEQWQTEKALLKSEQKLTEFNHTLEKQIKERTAELVELASSQKELEERLQQQIFRAVLDTQEVERKRIAETLHNSLGQILYAVKLSLSTVNKSLLNGNDKESLKNADKLLNDAITESRRMSHELMPVILEDFGLKNAIEDICRQFTGTIKFKCRINGLNRQLHKYLETAIYRIIQELMINIVKHSGATEATVNIEVKKKGMLVTVEDNGKGLVNYSQKYDGIGLKTIRNNVNLLNGKINIASKPDKGTIISIDIPVKPID
ncbi:MAG TPA: GAF domain-containing protein [Mucilaginibacter sp.]|nr:GAF domain-containing protein [Mucilaginibacter sp.]